MRNLKNLKICIKNKVPFLFLLSLLTIGASFSRAADSPSTATLAALPKAEGDVFLAQMREAVGGIRSLRCDFAQERHIAAFLDTLTAKGVCYFETPAKLRWELTEPYASILIHDGKSVAKFNVEEGKLRKMRLGGEDMLRQVLGQITTWMRGDFSAAEKVYGVTVLKRGAKEFVIALEPKSKKLREMIRAIELAVDPKTFYVTRVTIREPGEDRVVIRFLRQKMNVDLAPALFDLEKPARD